MFGGAGLFRDGLMFGLVADNEIYLKADSETAERFREAGSRQFVYSREGKSAAMSYWSTPDDALDDPERLKEWAEVAFEAALRGQRSGKKKPAKKSSARGNSGRKTKPVSEA